jgi:endonuclease YncB( thermonuclease family)
MLLTKTLVAALFVVVLLGITCQGQSGGYVVRWKTRVINGNTIMVEGTKITLSGVELAKGYEAEAAAALKNRIGNKEVGCMVDGYWSGNNWAYCGDPKKKRSRDIRKTLNAWLVRSGKAMSDDDWGLFGSEESQAKRKGKGLWKKN